jgi:hypothetical protein
MTSAPKRRLFVIYGCLVAYLSVITFIEVIGRLSPRRFGISIFAGMVLFTFILTQEIKRQQRRKQEPPVETINVSDVKKLKRGILYLKIWVGLMLLALVFGLWDTVGEPLWSRLIGVTINLYINVSLIVAIKNTQRKLKQFNAELT